MNNLFNAKYLSELLEGEWFVPPSTEWAFDTVAISKQQCQVEEGKSILFIAIDENTWHEGSGNRGIYAGWKDTHEMIKDFQDMVSGVIVQRPIKDLDKRIPQLVVTNTYQTISILAQYVRNNLNGKIIALTGTAGKSTTKELLKHVLSIEGDIVATRGNHNTRTGVPLTVACGVNNPDYMILEVAISSLWMRSGGVCKDIHPHIGIVTEIGGGQQKTPLETAQIKSKICEGIVPGGFALLNKDMLHFDVIKEEVENYGAKVVTYGFDTDSDVYLIESVKQKAGTKVKANILGEIIEYDVPLLGDGMIRNTLATLATVKLLDLSIKEASARLIHFKGKESVLQFEQIRHYKGGEYTLIDDSWNATEVSMLEAIDVLKHQSQFYSGKKIAILGRIENLGTDAERQHKRMIQPLIDSGIDLLFAHGPEMKYVLKELPYKMIGGYFEDAKSCAKAVAQLLEPGDLALLKGSPRSSDFKFMKKELRRYSEEKDILTYKTLGNSLATNHVAMTLDITSGEICSYIGDKNAVQKQGIGNVLLLALLMDKLFAKKVDLHDIITVNGQVARESKSARSLMLREGEEVKLSTLLDAFVINDSPNSILAVAAHLFGNSNNALKEIQVLANRLSINSEAVKNVTGRRIPKNIQITTIDDLYKAAKYLFDRLPFELSILNRTVMTFKDETLLSYSNLIDLGVASHSLMYGQNQSMGVALSEAGGKKLITLVLGARDAFHRDYLAIESINQVIGSKEKEEVQQVSNNSYESSTYKVNILGDTYFGEFYTDIRKKRNVSDALTKYGYDYSFQGIRSILNSGDFNIANFEAALTEESESRLKPSKPFVLYAAPEDTVNTLKKEGINAVTLGNNHLMDFGENGLMRTLNSFSEADIVTFGAGQNVTKAERPFVQVINGRRIVYFSAYWYRNPMYRKYNFYATGVTPGVANLSGGLIEQIKEEKRRNPEATVVVFPHWGVDFKTVSPLQRRYAHVLVEAGADVILGHGAHMMQEIEKINNKWVVYSIGNGVFNSNGEYNIRHVAPYSFIAQLQFSDIKDKLRLYPIYSDNLATFWKPRAIDETQFSHLLKIQKTYGLELGPGSGVSCDKDELGYYLEFMF